MILRAQTPVACRLPGRLRGARWLGTANDPPTTSQRRLLPVLLDGGCWTTRRSCHLGEESVGGNVCSDVLMTLLMRDLLVLLGRL